MTSLFGLEDDVGIKFPSMNTSNVVGIAVAISGNILISLALNLQKLAHKRLKAESQGTIDDEPTGRRHRGDELESLPELAHEADSSDSNNTVAALETDPLLPPSPSVDYSRARRHRPGAGKQSELPRRSFFSRLWLGRSGSETPAVVLPVDIVTNTHERRYRVTRGPATPKKDVMQEDDGMQGNYLKSKLWWIGFLLMNLGEMGNFISYAFAPASVVAPLGTFALIANCIFAPLMLKERFRKLDVIGVFIAIIGAVTVIFAANTSDTRLDQDGIIRAISQRAFIVYTTIYLVAAVILVFLSSRRIGKRFVLIDVGLCALFGGFTVLSTKGVSTLITVNGYKVFALWIVYPIALVLILTGIGQIRYLNRALMRFDSKVVIPMQFVLFNLSAIIGSAILYGDFKRVSFHQFVTFLYGCAATFAGVFIITWESPSSYRPSDSGNDDIEHNSIISSDGRARPGQRDRAALIIPGSVPVLRHRTSSLSVVGLSPGQGLLLVHTPPQNNVFYQDGLDNSSQTSLRRPSSFHQHSWSRRRYDDDLSPPGRRRTVSWLPGAGQETPDAVGNRTNSQRSETS